jgi:hypothetical protein
MSVAVAWGAQTNVVPNYQCTSITSTGNVSISSGTKYPLDVPSGMQLSIRTKAAVFKAKAFVAFAFGAQCQTDGQ